MSLPLTTAPTATVPRMWRHVELHKERPAAVPDQSDSFTGVGVLQVSHEHATMDIPDDEFGVWMESFRKNGWQRILIADKCPSECVSQLATGE